MTKAELIEALADIEHQRWSDWQKWLHECTSREIGILDHKPTGGRVISEEKYNHWERLIATPYADLPEHSKQSDREQVMRYWPLIVEYVAEWIETHDMSPVGEYLTQVWKEEAGDA